MVVAFFSRIFLKTDTKPRLLSAPYNDKVYRFFLNIAIAYQNNI